MSGGPHVLLMVIIRVALWAFLTVLAWGFYWPSILLGIFAWHAMPKYLREEWK